MISLPICQWRDSSRQDGCLCHSPRYLLAPNPVRAEFCAACGYADQDAPPLPPVLPCVHLGSLTGKKDRFECALHGQCLVGEAESRLHRKVPSCRACPDYQARDPFGPNSAQMHHRAEAFLAGVPDYPRGRYRARGVVIAGGGDRYFASLYVTIRALRHVGCRLPIQVWYLGRNDEMPAERKALLAPFQVACVDADTVRRKHPARRLNGWELKVFATLHSPFEEVLFLDADCYPCRNPEFLFDLADYGVHGAIFWPDMATYDSRLKWPAFGVSDPRRPGSVESGQYVINKQLTWKPLNLAWFYNNYSDYYYRYCYGDKHTFEVAWTSCKKPFVMWESMAHWATVAYLHPGPDNLPLFIHRCADKFRLDRHAYITNQNCHAPTFHSQLPLERECWGWMAELARLMGRRLDLPFFKGIP